MVNTVFYKREHASKAEESKISQKSVFVIVDGLDGAIQYVLIITFKQLT
jgi:hypothetical protein